MNNFYLKNEEDENKQKHSSMIEERILKTRKIVVSSDVNPKLSERIINMLILLEEEDPDKDIYFFINSPGGEVHSGFAIFDMMRFVKPKIKTIVSGFAASMGSIISLAADKGNRFALPNAKILIHQPLLSGVFRGSTAEIEIQAKEMKRIKNKIIQIYVDATGKSEEEIKRDIDRDFWMDAEEAQKYGLIDSVITNMSEIEN